MLDVSSSEFLLVMVIALVVIGPKDLPKVLRFVGKWVGKARSVAAQFRSGFDDMVRQSEMEELEQKWKAENERIMAMHPADTDTSQPSFAHPQDENETPPVSPEPKTKKPANSAKTSKTSKVNKTGKKSKAA